MTLTNSHLLLVAPLALALGCGPRETSRPAGGQPPGAARPAGREVVQTTEERVRAMLRRLEFEFDGESYHALLGMGERAFPAFEEILADPNSDPGRVCNVYCLLCNGPADPAASGNTPSPTWRTRTPASAGTRPTSYPGSVARGTRPRSRPCCPTQR